MKIDNSDENEESLSALLKKWKPEASLPPRFQEQVWRRIARAGHAPVTFASLARAYGDRMVTMLSQPALAAAYVMVLLVVGAGLGWSQARHVSVRVTGELGERYAQAVDPHKAISYR